MYGISGVVNYAPHERKCVNGTYFYSKECKTCHQTFWFVNYSKETVDEKGYKTVWTPEEFKDFCDGRLDDKGNPFKRCRTCVHYHETNCDKCGYKCWGNGYPNWEDDSKDFYLRDEKGNPIFKGDYIYSTKHLHHIDNSSMYNSEKTCVAGNQGLV